LVAQILLGQAGRMENPFKRLAHLAAVHRFNEDPHGWLQAFSDAATERGRAAIATLLSELPSAFRHVMTEEAYTNTTSRRVLPGVTAGVTEIVTDTVTRVAPVCSKSCGECR
jgi:hypothetical protein